MSSYKSPRKNSKIHFSRTLRIYSGLILITINLYDEGFPDQQKVSNVFSLNSESELLRLFRSWIWPFLRESLENIVSPSGRLEIFINCFTIRGNSQTADSESNWDSLKICQKAVIFVIFWGLKLHGRVDSAYFFLAIFIIKTFKPDNVSRLNNRGLIDIFSKIIFVQIR